MILLELTLASLLVAVATLGARRLGPKADGVFTWLGFTSCFFVTELTVAPLGLAMSMGFACWQRW